MPAIRKLFRDPRPTGARLRRTSRINLDNLSRGAFCLRDKHLNKLRPSCIVNGLRQHSASESFHVQILDGDHAVSVDQPARFLVLEIRPLITDVDVRAQLEQPHCFTPAVTALPAPRHFALTAPQTGFSIPVVSGILNLSPVGKHRQT